MTKKELVQFLIENFKDDNGDLDLNDLDFSEFEGGILINGIKTPNDLYQSRHQVRGNLLQAYHEVQGDVYQDQHAIRGNLIQSFQKVQGKIFDGMNRYLDSSDLAKKP